MMTRDGVRRIAVALLSLCAALAAVPSHAAVKPRSVVILPFDASALERDEQWIGEGIGEVIALGLAQHPAFVQIDRSRSRTVAGRPELWGEAVVLQAARALKADAALYGRVTKQNAEYVVQPRVVELKGGEPVALEPLTVTEADMLARLATLPVSYARTLKVPLTDAESRRIEKAAMPTKSVKAFELYSRAQMAAARGGQEANETAVDLLARAIEVDANFVVAQYTLGAVHQSLGNRWKAAAQFRASTQLDPSYPEPYKALGDLFLAAPRRLFDQAVEAYQKAIELRPFYADAHVGLGDARAAKGDVDGAITAYQKALAFNAVNPRVYMSLGKIYYSEKGLYYESVQAYKRAIDLDAQSVEARMGLGEVYEDKGLWKEAVDEYRKVIELDDKHTGAMYNLAMVYEKTDPKEAMAQWERYIALASQLPNEKDWVDVARQHLRKLKGQVKE
ncbi:MAG TPA: tetratricopeptide repeat protein [Methylomirabilota bacterium]|jgi:tetratricopeptide (TPR) repeat protein/TolB-like protein|nr:tetratricopeptide repeat protein [Methylomirabilota bacterium]